MPSQGDDMDESCRRIPCPVPDAPFAGLSVHGRGNPRERLNYTSPPIVTEFVKEQ